jgi:UDP-glucose 4-epimerase
MENVLITGGAGFVGSHLAEALAKKPAIKIVIADNFYLGSIENLGNNENYSIERADISSQSTLFTIIKNYDIDTIWHLATIPLPTSIQYPEFTIHNNINCAVSVCEAKRSFPELKVINVSSSEIFGTAKQIPMNEEHPLNPETPYAASKASSDLIFESYSRTFGLSFLTLRPFNMFGPKQNKGTYAGVIPIFIKKILRGEEVNIFGDGNQTRDFTYVKNSVDAFINVLNFWDGNTSLDVNIGSGKETTINELLIMLCAALDVKAPRINYLPARLGDVSRHCCDSRKYSNLTNQRVPEISISALKDTISYYANLV